LRTKNRKRKRKRRSQRRKLKVISFLLLDSKEKEIKLDASEESGSEEGSESEGSESEKSGSDHEKDEEHERTILYEDEKYFKELENTKMAYEDIQEYLEDFVDYA
jgi:TATA-binding protein-associated factor Taf7